MQLVIGNRAYSSWSLRAWFAIKQSGLSYQEIVLPLWTDEFRTQIYRYSPAGQVPVLIHDGHAVWDCLSIGEYLHELAPDKGLWPEDPKARATARSLCAEMHSRFMALRESCPMQTRRQVANWVHTPETLKNIKRIDAIWSETPWEFSEDDGFLFGEWCLADAFYAPLALRFSTYGAELSKEAQRYMDTVLAHPWVKEWVAAADQETWKIDRYDIG